MGIFDFFKKNKEEEIPLRIAKDFHFHSVVGKNGDGIARKIVEYFGDKVEEAVDTHKNFVDEDVLSYFEGEDTEKEFPIQDWTRIFRIKLKDGTEINGEIDDSEMAAKYGAGLAEHFSDVNIKDENLKQMLLTQIAFFNCKTKLMATFDFYKSGKKKNEKVKLLDFILGAGKSFDGYPLFSTETLYSPDKKVFVSKKIGTEFKEFTPFIPKELIDNFEMTDEDNARMARSIEEIEADGLPYLENMHTSISEARAVIPDKELIIKRAAAIQMTGIASELYNEMQENSKEKIKEFLEIFEKQYGIKEVLTNEEKNYLEKYTDDVRINSEYNWRYECPPVLLWALSLQELTDLSTICNVKGTIEYFMENDLETLMNKAELRSKDEIMDMLDYLYRLNWSAVELRIRPENHNNKKFPYDESIIHFRRLALEWLVQPEKSIEDVEAEMHT